MPAAKIRLFYIDNLRLLFTVLVILHHVAITYAARSGWYYYENTSDPFTNFILNILMSLNRTWVIGCFFMISGYFTPASLDKKGFGWFMKDRFMRLIIPLAIFSFLVRPTIVYVMDSRLAAQYTYLENIFFMKNVAPGPAWFLEVLFIFSLIYGLFNLRRPAGRENTLKDRPFPGDMAVLALIIILAAATFLVRIYFPTEKQVFRLRLGNYVEYITFFWVGIAAYRNQWFEKLSDTAGKKWTLITVLSVLAYCAIITYSWYSGISLSFLRGGLSLGTFIATFVEGFIAVGSSISLIYLFRKFFNTQPQLVKAMADNAYAVFIFHAPILVAFTVLIRQMMTGHPFAKFILVFITGTILCFLVSHFVIRKLPFVRKIL